MFNKDDETTSGEALDQDPAGTTRRDFLRMAGMAGAGFVVREPTSQAALLAGVPASMVQASSHPAVHTAASAVKEILVPANAHPAMRSAARILAKKLKLGEEIVRTYDGPLKPASGAIVLALAKDGKLPVADLPKRDGYTVLYTGGVVVYGARPRSLLFAAGEPEHWVGRTTVYRRNPEFALRNTTWHPDNPVADQAAIFGANFFIANLPASPALKALNEVHGALTPDQQKQLLDAGEAHKARNAAAVKEFREADVEVYALLPYGVNFETWSPSLYKAVVKVYPSAKGTPEPNSHESAALCPSDPAAWKVMGVVDWQR